MPGSQPRHREVRQQSEPFRLPENLVEFHLTLDPASQNFTADELT